MKKALILLFIFCIPAHIKGMAYVKNCFSRFYPTVNQPQNTIHKAQVATISLLREIEFKQAVIQLFTAAQNKDIEAILLIIDNGGGPITTFSMLHDLIKKITTLKPVVALIIGSAQSGGYMVASACNYIIAHSCSEIGSIGVVTEMAKYNNPHLNERVKAELTIELFQEGEYKTTYNPYHVVSDKEIDYVKKIINKHYQKFINMVAHNRNLNKEEYLKWADGKFFISEEALELGLIDEIGTIFEADAKLVQLLRAKNPDKVIEDAVIHIDFDASPPKN